MATSFPPHQHHATRRVSPSEAVTLLSTYLHQAITDPSLHPNALLTEDGPITPSTGSTTGLILHNLERLEAGLRGERLATEQASLTRGDINGQSNMNGIIDHPDSKGVEGRIDEEGERVMGMDWQDRGEFEREQDIVQGEIGLRDNAVMDGGHLVDGEEASVRGKVKIGDGAEKEMRRRAKKERKKQLKRDMEGQK